MQQGLVIELLLNLLQRAAIFLNMETLKTIKLMACLSCAGLLSLQRIPGKHLLQRDRA